MASYFLEIPEEHQLPFSELTESFNLLRNIYMSSVLKMSSCFIVSLFVSPVFWYTSAHRTLQAELTIRANLLLETMENNMTRRLQLTNNTIT